MKPTFPIDQKQIEKKSRERVFGSPITWAAWVPTVALWSVMDVASWMFLPLGIVTGVGLWWYWRHQLRKLRPQWTLIQIKKSNQEQEQMLSHQIKAFQKAGATWEANALRTVREQKKGVEQQLFKARPDFVVWSRIETLVDILAFSLVDKLIAHAAAPNKEDQREIEEAISQIYQTNSDLPLMIAPTRDLEQGTPDVRLATTLEALKEEREIAHRVKARLESGLSETTMGSPGQVSE